MINENYSIPKSMAYFLPAFRSLMFILFGYIPLWLRTGNSAVLTDTAKWWPVSFVFVNILTLILLNGLLKKEGKRFSSLFKHVDQKKLNIKEALWVIPLMLVLGMGGLVGFSLLINGQLPTNTLQPLPLWSAILVLLTMPLSVMFTEMPFYLGFCSSHLEKKNNMPVFSIVYPLFFFALQHSFIPLLWDIQHIVTRFLVFVPLLIFIGMRYAKTRDLRMMMIGHGVLDLFTAIQLFVVSLDPSIYEIMMSNS